MKKGPDDFQFPFVPLIGANVATLRKIDSSFHVDSAFNTRYRLSKLIAFFLEPFRATERWTTGKKIERFMPESDPVFIIGHWRSGTTYLHNLLSKDNQFGFCSTYQSLLPELTLVHQAWLSPLIKLMMPSQRPADHVELNLAYPQEEEFALGNLLPWSFYYSWYFPKQFSQLLAQHSHARFDEEQLRTQWKVAYSRFIRTALINTGGKIYLSKNPPHTFRIGLLTEMFPKARFIFIIRNPYEVLESSARFIRGVLPTTQLQGYNDNEIEDVVMQLMDVVFDRYEATRHLILPGNLVEVIYENLVHNPVQVVGELYNKLNLKGFEQVLPSLHEFTSQNLHHQVASYKFKADTIRRVNSIWKNLFDRMGYTRLPDSGD